MWLLPSRYQVAAILFTVKWLASHYQVATKWLTSGYQVVTKWLASDKQVDINLLANC